MFICAPHCLFQKEYKDAVMDICNSLQELDVHKATRQQSRHTLASGSASGLFSGALFSFVVMRDGLGLNIKSSSTVDSCC